MSKQLLTILSLAVLVSIVLTACGPAPTPTPTPTPPESPAPTPTTPPKPEGSPQPPQTSFTPAPKPTLRFKDIQTGQQAIGFVFLTGPIPLKAATLQEPKDKENLIFGYVELGRQFGNIPADTYEVSVEKSCTDTQQPVQGWLTPVKGTPEAKFPVSFKCSRLTINPRWQNYPLDPVYVSITSNAVCFAAKDQQGQWWRYCSNPGSLSVRDNFPDQFKVLTEMVSAAAKSVDFDPALLDLNLTISEMEHPENIQDCNQNANCGPDIIGAPLTCAAFRVQYSAARTTPTPTGPTGVPAFPVTAGVVRVMRNITITLNAPIPPDAYRLEFWFSPGNVPPDDPAVDPWPDVFVKATISGPIGSAVQQQQIPAVEARFSDAQPSSAQCSPQSQISAWRVFRWCSFWQPNCH